jgi:hypothetical protein
MAHQCRKPASPTSTTQSGTEIANAVSLSINPVILICRRPGDINARDPIVSTAVGAENSTLSRNTVTENASGPMVFREGGNVSAKMPVPMNEAGSIRVSDKVVDWKFVEVSKNFASNLDPLQFLNGAKGVRNPFEADPRQVQFLHYQSLHDVTVNGQGLCKVLLGQIRSTADQMIDGHRSPFHAQCVVWPEHQGECLNLHCNEENSVHHPSGRFECLCHKPQKN